MNNAGIYIHYPFCEKKCLYCSFYSKKSDEHTKELYISRLKKEIMLFAEKNPVNDLRIKSIYFGGGTPSLISVKNLDEILNLIFKYYKVHQPEITIEVNPNSSENLFLYPKLAINRLSIGVQSLDDNFLKKIGRLHTADEAMLCLMKASQYFDNISADLILGIDNNQKPQDDFMKIKPFIKHLSAYILTPEQNTPLYTKLQKNEIAIADEETQVIHFNNIYEITKEYGFNRYETSNYALQGYESLHNISYWNLTDYLGFGASAHSYYNGKRYYNVSNLNAYLNGQHSGYGLEIIERCKNLSEDIYEYIMLMLRTSDGVEFETFKNKFGCDFPNSLREKINKNKKYLALDGVGIKILPQYFIVQNQIIGNILEDYNL